MNSLIDTFLFLHNLDSIQILKIIVVLFASYYFMTKFYRYFFDYMASYTFCLIFSILCLVFLIIILILKHEFDLPCVLLILFTLHTIKWDAIYLGDKIYEEFDLENFDDHDIY